MIDKIIGATVGTPTRTDKTLSKEGRPADAKAVGDALRNISIPEGGTGENGATFTPSVSPDGTLSWENDKGLTNPQPVNIKGKDGNTGIRGSKILKVTTAPSSYTTEVGGFTPTYRIALSTVKSQSGATEVLANDVIFYTYYHYPVGYVDGSYVYCGARQSIRGSTGAAGANGYTPVKGTDYFTDEDKNEIANIATENVKDYVNEVATDFASQDEVKTLERSVAAVVQAYEETADDVYDHNTNMKNPHKVTATQVGAPTVAQMNEAIAAASIGGGSGGGTASSWEDLGHGIGLGTILEETTLTLASTQLDEVFGLIVGNEYKVMWNGVEYTPTATDASVLANVEGAVLLGMSAKYPFTILAKPGIGTMISVDKGNLPVTVSVTGVGYITLPIPGKYLPKGTPWIGEGVGCLLENTHATSIEHPEFGYIWQIQGKQLSMELGKTYTVNYNSVDYECVCALAPEGFIDDPDAVFLGNLSAVGGEDTGEPFVMLISDKFAEIDIVDLSSAALVVVSISGYGEIPHKLDNRCLDLAWLPTTKKHEVELFSGTLANGDSTGLTREQLPPSAEVVAIIDGERREYTVLVWSFILLFGDPNGLGFSSSASGQPWKFSCTDNLTHDITLYRVDTEYNQIPDGFISGQLSTINLTELGLPVVEENTTETLWESSDLNISSVIESLGKGLRVPVSFTVKYYYNYDGQKREATHKITAVFNGEKRGDVYVTTGLDVTSGGINAYEVSTNGENFSVSYGTTSTDKNQLIADVIAALPVYNGEAVIE